MVDSSYGYELQLRQKYSLCWFQAAACYKFQLWCHICHGLQAQKSSYCNRVSMSDGTVVTVYGRGTVTAGSRCEVQLSQVTGAHRMMSTCVEKRWTEPVIVGYKCSKSTATYATLLILLSKVATRNHMIKIKATMPGNAVSDRLSTVSLQNKHSS